MNYYIDTEFLEGTQKEKFPISLFRKETPNTIDLISIGIVAEDGREYYAISKDFNLKEAWNRFQLEQQSGDMRNIFPEGKKVYWIRENVLKPIWIDLFLLYESDFTFLKGKAYDDFEKELKNGVHDKLFTFKSFKALVNRYGKTNKEIAIEIQEFVYDFAIKGYDENIHQIETTKKLISNFKGKVEFYAYYADYDWVAFCWLFGKMIDLPNAFPNYCNDLKQILDEKAMGYFEKVNPGEHNFKERLESIKIHPDYPKQTNEHNALADARWNKELHNFLKNL